MTIIQGSGPGYGPFGASWTQKNFPRRWDALDQVRGLDWYFNLQVMVGGQAGSPILRTLSITPRLGIATVAAPNMATLSGGLWNILAPGTNSSGGVDPGFFTTTCPPGEPRCPLHVRVQVALRMNPLPYRRLHS